jgi:hypothetical protein
MDVLPSSPLATSPRPTHTHTHSQTPRSASAKAATHVLAGLVRILIVGVDNSGRGADREVRMGLLTAVVQLLAFQDDNIIVIVQYGGIEGILATYAPVEERAGARPGNMARH